MGYLRRDAQPHSRRGHTPCIQSTGSSVYVYPLPQLNVLRGAPKVLEEGEREGDAGGDGEEHEDFVLQRGLT